MGDRFAPLLQALLRSAQERLGESLVGVAVYGSVARGTAGPSSDVDVLLVAEGWPREGRLARDLIFHGIEDAPAVTTARSALAAARFSAELSPLLWSPEELDAFTYLHLDLATDARVLYDPRGRLGARFAAVRAKMAEWGTRKVPFRGGWYWLLKPDLKPGEVIDL